MKAHTLLRNVATVFGAGALVLALGACRHQPLTAGQNSGQIRTEAAAQEQPTPPAQVIGSAPAPANIQGAEPAPSTPAVISGPAVIDNSGNAYTSSAQGSAGNASSIGTNTNVNIIPKSAPSEAVVTTTPAPEAPAVVETTPAPAPAPVVKERPAPVPAPAPMVSSTTEAPVVHRRLRKD